MFLLLLEPNVVQRGRGVTNIPFIFALTVPTGNMVDLLLRAID